MITPLQLKPNSFDRNVILASTYLTKTEKFVDPVVEFLRRECKMTSPALKNVFSDLIKEPAELSYQVSHGAVGQRLNVVSK